MLRVGALLYGHCGGYFGDSYGTKRVEAIGVDWTVARELGENEPPLFCGDITPEELEEYTQLKEDR